MMRATIVLRAAAAAAGTPQQSDQIVVRVWQFEPDGSRFSTGRREAAAAGDTELHLTIGDPMTTGFFRQYRLDATMALHDVGDSTMVGGIVAAGEVTGSRRMTGRSSLRETRATIDERRFHLRQAVARGEAIWFFPFGRPQAGERGVGLEITRHDTVPTGARAWSGARLVVMTAHDLGLVARPARPARVRLEVGGPASFNQVYEGPIRSFVPIEVPVPNAPRGARLAFTVVPAPWFTGSEVRCWTWAWADGQPPSGGHCLAAGDSLYRQMLYGSKGQSLRVTVLGG
jgi:hypothetical protein